MAASFLGPVIFDLDGTLVDSTEDIIVAFNQGLCAVGTGPMTEQEIRPLIGIPLIDMYERAVTGGDPEFAERACEAYRRFYFDHSTDNTRLFPGVAEALDALRTRPLAIATTKKTYMAVRLMAQLGLDDRFSLIQGTDDIPAKPDPAVLLLVARKLGIPPGRAWMVGDTVHDMAAAKAAGMNACAVTYGVTETAKLRQCQPDLVVDDLRDFAKRLDLGDN